MEELRTYKAAREKLKLERELREICSMEEMNRFLQHISYLLRDFGSRLQQISGDGFDVFDEVMQDVTNSTDEFFNDESGGNTQVVGRKPDHP